MENNVENKQNSEQLNILAVSKRSNLKNELAALHVELNSRYGAYGHIEPSLEQQKIIRDRIDEINEELKNGC
jgi:hypothetical protein